ncbi:MAG: hypothetical protein EP329_01845 [Deltaproteobacteria bacterium]|nr:MAG: hypothetical protein EP329_01845 [Deltaproteobacteria bacterium]
MTASQPPSRLYAALRSIVIGVPFGAALLGLAVVLGWIDLSAPAGTSEIGIGIGLAALTAFGSTALQQLVSRLELGPEVLLGPLVWYVELLIVGRVFEAPSDLAKTVFGALFVLGLVLQLALVGARVTWALRGAPDRG